LRTEAAEVSECRPATRTLDDVERLLAAIDVTASLALPEAGAVELAS